MRTVPTLATPTPAQTAEAAHLSAVIAQREILLGQLAPDSEAHTLHAAALAAEKDKLATLTHS